ncbi:Fe(2+) transporter permease subunit FeoB [Chitinibacteraceae bacterium HSL-7]
MSALTIALAGNPNCGKTTLFNALTGSNQTVGNWPGVTVERKSGWLKAEGQQIEVVDLPGVYSLNTAQDSSADEQVARQYLLGGGAQLVVNVVDAANLERNLYLTTQLLELGVPVIVVLNMIDVATRQGVRIDTSLLEDELGCPVFAVSAARKQGLAELKRAIAARQARVALPRLDLPAELVAAQAKLKQALPGARPSPDWVALKLLEGDHAVLQQHPALKEQVASAQQQVLDACDLDADIVIADARFRLAGQAVARSRTQAGLISRHLTAQIDHVVLNRWLGLPIFLAVMYLMFLFTIHIGSALIDVFDLGAAALLVNAPGHWLNGIGAPQWLTVALAGLGGGVQTVATFIPVIGCLFLFLSVLEDSGYMARAAFVMDRAMRALGLPGKSFVPLLIGFGCNVPAIMATRTLETRRDRILTSMMAPFMSCGARLPVYALFAAAFFPHNGQNVVFALYLIGIVFAVITAVLLRRTALPGDGAPLVMELPRYHLPQAGNILRRTWQRLRDFIVGAGRIIVPMVLVLSVLNSVSTDGSFGHEDTDASVLARVGQTIAPAFAPMGIEQDNWQAAVGLFTGILAKEAVVGTLNALYSPAEAPDAEFNLADELKAALATVPANLVAVADKLGDPLGISIGDVSSADAAAASLESSTATFAAMQGHFHGASGAFAYLLMILLYTPCLAALGAMRAEVGTGWMLFAAGWTFAAGYSAATVFYQISHWGDAPLHAAVVLGALVLAWLAITWGARQQLATRTRTA